MTVINAFVAHLLRGKPLTATGAEGINELELSNAIYLSGFEGRAVELPVDAKRIERLIARLERERSTGDGGALRAKCTRRLNALLREST